MRADARATLLAVILTAACRAHSGGTAVTTPAPASCGQARPVLEAIPSAEGLVIAPDGTIYFSQPFGGQNPNWLGRYRPPYDDGPETKWLDMGGNALGITIDPGRHVLYAGSRTLKKLLVIDLNAPTAAARPFADVEDGFNGVTLGEDAAVYYSDQNGGHLYRIGPDGAKTRVTQTPLTQPNGVAFGPDGRLYIVSWTTPEVTRLTLAKGVETARELFATLPDIRGDGIAFDARGRLLVTAKGQLYRIGATGTPVEPIGPSYGANVEFGVGALSCTDVYVAGNGKGILRHEYDTPGRNVPWHRR
jgi:hypothetical protein